MGSAAGKANGYCKARRRSVVAISFFPTTFLGSTGRSPTITRMVRCSEPIRSLSMGPFGATYCTAQASRTVFAYSTYSRVAGICSATRESTATLALPKQRADIGSIQQTGGGIGGLMHHGKTITTALKRRPAVRLSRPNGGACYLILQKSKNRRKEQ